MESSNGKTTVQSSSSASADLGPTATVVVATGGGTRYHRPNGLGFETRCKTSFTRPVQSVVLAEAVEEGFTPCRKPGCFGET